MTYPVAPVGTITRRPPTARGYIELHGYARDWRPAPTGWAYHFAEYIDEIGAMAPVAQWAHADMVLAADGGPWGVTWGDATYWTTDCQPYGYPAVNFAKSLDSAVYADTTAGLKSATHTIQCSGTYTRNWTCDILHYAPPYGQGVIPQVVIGVPAWGWYPHYDGDLNAYTWGWGLGQLNLYLPLHAEGKLPNPVLHWIGYEQYGYPGDGYILMSSSGEYIGEFPESHRKGHKALREHAATWETVTWETYDIVDADHGYTYSWIRIGLSGADRDWWVKSNRFAVLEGFGDGAGPSIGISVVGHVAAVNLTPIRYGAASAFHLANGELPYGVNANLADWTWSTRTDLDLHDWTVTTTNYETAWAEWREPNVAWTPGDTSERVCVYNVSGQCSPQFAAGDTTSSATTGTHKLRSLSYERNVQWRGATGSASFIAEVDASFSTWTLGSELSIVAGWDADSDLPAQTVMLAYITDEVRQRDVALGPGRAVYDVQFGDYVAALLRDCKKCIDFRDAAGQLLGDWFRYIWERVGVQSTYVDVCTRAETYTIKEPGMRGDEQFLPRDGDSVEQHLDTVTGACGFRWGVSATGRPFLEERYAYVHGTSTVSFTLNEATATEIDYVEVIDNEQDYEGRINRWKAIVGTGDSQKVYYGQEPSATVAAGIGHAIEEVLQFDTEQDYQTWLNGWMEKRDRASLRIRWQSIHRPDLSPGLYVEVDAVQFIGVTTGTVFQIETESVRLEADSLTGQATYEGAVVYEP